MPPTSARSCSPRRSSRIACSPTSSTGTGEDIGTVGAFHKANIDLTSDNPPFDFTFGDNPIFTRPRYLPCSRLSGVTVNNSLISDGCVIGRGSVIENSVIGIRAQIAENVTIRNTYIMGADNYEQRRHLEDNIRANRPNIGVGADSIIENAIIDKNARIGQGVRIRNEAGIVDSDDAPPLRHPRQDRGDPQVHDPPGSGRDLSVHDLRSYLDPNGVVSLY